MWLNIVFYKPHGCSCMKEHVFHSTTELWACVFSATTSHRGNVILGWRYRGRTGEDSRLLWECVAADVYRCCWLSGGWRWGWWSSSPLAWQWTDRQRCGLYHIWRTPHGLTDTQTQGQDPRCSNTHTHTYSHTHTHTHIHTHTHTHTNRKCLRWWSTWQSASRPAAKYSRACFDALKMPWITLSCTVDTVSLYHHDILDNRLKHSNF